MNRTDELGYNFEMSNIECLKGNGFGKYIKYANPSNTWAWKRKREIGVDMVLQLGEDTYYIEESFCSYSYKLSQSWFDQCRRPRFRDYPNDATHHHIILTNHPENFSGVSGATIVGDSSAVVTGVTMVVTVNWLLRLIRNYDTTILRTTNNPNAYDRRLEELIVKPRVEVSHPCQVDHPDHEKWLERQLELAYKCGENS